VGVVAFAGVVDRSSCILRWSGGGATCCFVLRSGGLPFTQAAHHLIARCSAAPNHAVCDQLPDNPVSAIRGPGKCSQEAQSGDGKHLDEYLTLIADRKKIGHGIDVTYPNAGWIYAIAIGSRLR
jgi:hypothetical protein